MSFMLFVLAAAASATSVEGSREAYNNCMLDLTLTMLKAKKSPDDFAAAAKTECEAERVAFHAAVVKDERAMGSAATAAQEFADEEVIAVQEDFTAGYADHVEYGTVPVK